MYGRDVSERLPRTEPLHDQAAAMRQRDDPRVFDRSVARPCFEQGYAVAALAQTQRQRGAGEADAAKIYADAYRGEEEFYGFLRTLEVYEKVINEQTTLVLPADAPLLKLLLQSPRSGGGKAAPPSP